MSILRSDKENLAVSFQVPKTPGIHGSKQAQKAPLRTPMQARAGKFVTPTSRVPLGGKSTNAGQLTTHKPALHQTVVKTTQKPSAKRQPPLSGPLQTSSTKTTQTSAPIHGESATAQVSHGDYSEWEVETIHPADPPLPNIPLDHIELDYDAIKRATRFPPLYVLADPNLDKSVDEALNDLDDFDDVQELEFLTGEPLVHQPSQHTRAGIRTPVTSRPLQNSRAPVASRSFMAPTVAAQAKQKPGLKGPTKPLGGRTNASVQRRPRAPQVVVNITSEELGEGLDFDL